jgi:hypothetical protein
MINTLIRLGAWGSKSLPQASSLKPQVLSLIFAVLFPVSALVLLAPLPAQAVENILINYQPGNTDNNCHYYRTYNGISVGDATRGGGAALDDEAMWLVTRGHPFDASFLIGHVDAAGRNLYLFHKSGGSYACLSGGSALASLCYRGGVCAFDIAYEDNSGDALIVYAKPDDSTLYYRTWADGPLSAEKTISYVSHVYYPEWIRLVSRPGDNEIALVYSAYSGAGSEKRSEVAACIWNGSSWSDDIRFIYYRAVSISAYTHDMARPFDACYEQGGDRQLVVTHVKYNNRVYGWYFSPVSGWSGEQIIYEVGAADNCWGYFSLACKPESDKIIISYMLRQKSGSSTRTCLYAHAWDGSSFGDRVPLDDTCVSMKDKNPYMPVAAGWYDNGSGYNGVIVYGDGDSAGSIDWFESDGDGANWTLKGDVTTGAGGFGHDYYLRLVPTTGGRLILTSQDNDSNPDIILYQFSGGTDWTNLMGANSVLESSSTGSAGMHSFVAVGFQPDMLAPDIRAWDSAGKATEYDSGAVGAGTTPYFEFNSSELAGDDIDGFYYAWGTGAPAQGDYIWIADTDDNDCESWTVSPPISVSDVYYLYVKAHNGADSNSVAAVFEYRFEGTPPETPYCNNSPPGAQLGQTNPNDIADPTPNFSAIFKDACASETATHCRIQVGTDNEWDAAEMWDSPQVSLAAPAATDTCCPDVIYAGDSLSDSTRYYWRMRFVNSSGHKSPWSKPQTFKTGIIWKPREPTDLYCEGYTEPDNVTDYSPELSAVYSDDDGNALAAHYRIQAGTDDDWANGAEMWDSGNMGFTTPVQEGERCADITYYGVALEPLTMYYWRIRFINSSGFESPWSETQTFETIEVERPLAPTALYCDDYPPGAQTGRTNPDNISTSEPHFSAIYDDENASELVVSCLMEVGTDNEWTSAEMWNSGWMTLSEPRPPGDRIGDIVYGGAGLSGPATYYWRIRMRNQSDRAGPWSEAALFAVIDTQPPGQAANPSPANGETDVALLATLSWDGADGADGYVVYFGADVSPPQAANSSATEYDPGTLLPNTTYYWRVDTYNSFAVTTGLLWHFSTVDYGVPAKVANPDPADGATNVFPACTLRWDFARHALSYRIFLGESAAALDNIGEVSDNFITPTGGLKSGIAYYWRVDSINQLGTTEGDTWSFTVRGDGEEGNKAGCGCAIPAGEELSLGTCGGWLLPVLIFLTIFFYLRKRI